MLDKTAVQEILSLGVAVFARQALPSVTDSCLADRPACMEPIFWRGSASPRRLN